MRVVGRAVLLGLLALTIGAGGLRTAEAQLWKPKDKKPAAAAAKPARKKPVAKKPRRAKKPARKPAPAVVRDEAPSPRARATRADDLPEFDDSPVIVVELPARGER